MHLFTGDLYLVKQMKVSLKMRRYKQSWKESLESSGSKKNPYLTAGDKNLHNRCTQDGTSPDLGGHTPGEMGGVWNHLIKLLDGFWVKMTRVIKAIFAIGKRQYNIRRCILLEINLSTLLLFNK